MCRASRSAQGLFYSSLVLLVIALQSRSARAESPGDDADSAAVSPQQLALWVKQLDHRLFAEREKATEALYESGLVAVDPLTAAVDGESLEAADRAVGLLERFAAEGDRPLQLAALTSLVEATRFPPARRRADNELTELQEQICSEQFAAWGAKLEICHHCPTSAGRQTRVILTVCPEKWKGNRESFRVLGSLRRLDILKIDAPMVDDEVAHDLAQIESLRTLELINTQASIDLVDRLRRQDSLLTVRIRSRTYLGVTFWPGGSLEVMRVDPTSPAEQAGFRSGDVVERVNGSTVETFEMLTAHLAQLEPGDEVRIELTREQEPLELTARLASRDWTTE